MVLTDGMLLALRDACEVIGIKVRKYSGRAMYGSNCLGLEIGRDMTALNVAFSLSNELAESDEGDLLAELADVDWREDSLGLGSILYAPSLRWPDDLEDEDGDEIEAAS